jgi:hypothetical protein
VKLYSKEQEQEQEQDQRQGQQQGQQTHICQKMADMGHQPLTNPSPTLRQPCAKPAPNLR